LRLREQTRVSFYQKTESQTAVFRGN
jgi:hypothetical protein